MEFVGKECPQCGKKFGNRKPKDVTVVEPYETMKRFVSVVGPCPFCGEAIPLWAGDVPLGKPGPAPEPEPEPTAPSAEPEPES